MSSTTGTRARMPLSERFRALRASGCWVSTQSAGWRGTRRTVPNWSRSITPTTTKPSSSGLCRTACCRSWHAARMSLSRSMGWTKKPAPVGALWCGGPPSVSRRTSISASCGSRRDPCPGRSETVHCTSPSALDHHRTAGCRPLKFAPSQSGQRDGPVNPGAGHLGVNSELATECIGSLLQVRQSAAGFAAGQPGAVADDVDSQPVSGHAQLNREVAGVGMLGRILSRPPGPLLPPR